MSYKLKGKTKENYNIDLLFQFGLSDKNTLEIFNRSTRDIADLNVLKCTRSGVIVLERNMMPGEYYENNIQYTNEFKGKVKTTEGLIESQPLEDDIRRFEAYKNSIKGSSHLDFGCGRGGFIQLSDQVSKKSVGLELNQINREYLNSVGVHCVSEISELNGDMFDLITLNHVFEHLNDPINTLLALQEHLRDDGVIIIEVPHARDLLLETFSLESFKNFTFWSEHLILHTRQSLEVFAANSGLQAKKIEGFQRYPISNHYNWLLNGQPSGHEVFRELSCNDFHKHYEKLLDGIDQTDTLIGYFGKST